MENNQLDSKLLQSYVTIETTNKPLQIKRVTFKPGFTRENMLEILQTQKSIQVIQKDESCWFIFKDNQIKILDLFDYINECRISSICLINSSTMNQKIFMSIIPIKFELLKGMLLNGANIYSIEGLAFMNAPFLSTLMIKSNQITQVQKTINKLWFPNLQRLHLYEKNVRYFNGSKCRAKSSVGTQYEIINGIAKYVQDDVSFLAKLQFRLNSKHKPWVNSLKRFGVNQHVENFPLCNYQNFGEYNQLIQQPRAVTVLLAKIKHQS